MVRIITNYKTDDALQETSCGIIKKSNMWGRVDETGTLQFDAIIDLIADSLFDDSGLIFKSVPLRL